MRIIGGSLKGLRFNPPSNIPARPTTDTAKESLFNILQNNFYFEDVKFLDLFSGTGSLSYEMFSRGCRDITSVDISAISINFTKKCSKRFEMEDYQKIIKQNAFKHIKLDPNQYDVIFAGPPYPLKTIDLLPDLIMESNLLKKEGWFILETSPRHDYKNHHNLIKLKNYGQTHFWFFSHEK